jgi:hypothetical protein
LDGVFSFIISIFDMTPAFFLIHIVLRFSGQHNKRRHRHRTDDMDGKREADACGNRFPAAAVASYAAEIAAREMAHFTSPCHSERIYPLIVNTTANISALF